MSASGDDGLAGIMKDITSCSPHKKELSYEKHHSVSRTELETEPLLKPNPQRFVLFPIEYHDIWQYYKEAVAYFWSVEEINLSKDAQDWQSLSDSERHYLAHMLAFLATSDSTVLKNLLPRFSQEVQIPEARCFYGKQIAVRNIHSEMYSLLINTFIKDTNDQEATISAVEDMDSVQRLAKWAERWLSDSDTTFGERIVALAVTESVLFAGISASISYLKTRGVLPGLTLSNELITRDENLHCDFSCLIFKHLVKKPTKDRILSIIKEAVEIEKKFLSTCIPVSLVGLNCKLMTQYIEFVGDRLLVEFGCHKLWDTDNPFDFIGIEMFGTRNAGLAVGANLRVKSHEAHSFNMDDNF